MGTVYSDGRGEGLVHCMTQLTDLVEYYSSAPTETLFLFYLQFNYVMCFVSQL